ncbi:hypothetical protein GCM10010211_48650 [Streptomyces albospinus]|uniref:Uncharacterized protein n=2 Tax=Streptomyces TaxID=1883 RepID=A0A124HGZ7_9ACTN|nr:MULTISPECIES: hypothetical protein [Streptomyces]KUN08608.1 hypothetical protein AQI95_09660 [Streptomyces yokosukanensis]GGU77016.1 hypothetical protein GCM10010211_48650 [Streptomyces albospinus]
MTTVTEPETVTLTIRFEVTETTVTDVESTVTVPADIADDDEALQDWLDENEDQWIDDLDTDDAHDVARDVTDVYGTDA